MKANRYGNVDVALDMAPNKQQQQQQFRPQILSTKNVSLISILSLCVQNYCVQFNLDSNFQTFESFCKQDQRKARKDNNTTESPGSLNAREKAATT